MKQYVLPIALLGFLISAAPSAADASSLVVDGDVKITTDTVKRELDRLSSPERMAALADPGRFREVINTIYRRTKLAREAEAQGYPERPQVKYVMQVAAEQALIAEFVRDVKAGFEAPNFEALAREHYLANRDEYMAPEALHLRHILISNDGKQRLEELKQRIASGESFAALADEHSEDSGADSGGDLGWVVRGTTVPAFERAAYALVSPGDVSAPVETRFGWHLIQLVERRDERPLSFEEVRDGIVETKRAKYLRDMYVAWYREKTDFSGAYANDEVIEKLFSDLQPPQ